MVGRSALVLLSSALAVSAGCSQAENAVLIEARTQGDIESIQVTVIDRDGVRSASRSSPRPVRRSEAEINEGEPIRIAVPLPGPMDVLVHVVAVGRDPDDRFVATRCYEVVGLVRDTVLLVGPIGTDLDADGDAFPEDPGGACRDPGVGTATAACDFACTAMEGQDCDDSDPTIFPGARELCRDDVDQDCDGRDADCEDRDGDGFRSCSAADAPGTCDCEDGVAEINPGAEEECRDGVDQDCDGRDGVCDQDGDGFEADRDMGGTPDCDDTDGTVNPDADELCTPRDDPTAVARDEDCNGFIDDAADCTGDDLDRDGSPACVGGDPTMACTRTDCDCNDCDPGVRPGALDRCGNGIDEDQRAGDSVCPAVDGDGDGFAPASAGGSDCNDADPDTFPGAPERCGDTIAQSCIADAECSGDADMDGYVPPSDCGPMDAMQAPGIAETCNQLDDDCDGVTNEVLSTPAGTFLQGTSGCVLGDGRLGASCAGGRACITDFLTSVFHCGGCRVECNVPGGNIVADQCVGGACDCSSDSSATAPCGGGTTCCTAAGCRNLDDDPEHCGYCGRICGENADHCGSGTCVCGGLGRACDAGLDGARITCCGAGCVDVETDEENCGVCGNVCGPQSSCQAGRCTCDTGFGDCDFSQATGCEVDIRTSVPNCGGCGIAFQCTRAGATPVCADCMCRIGTCNPLRDDCDSNDSTGCETPLDTLSDCGSCRTGCSRANATATCGGGTCSIQACVGNFGNCDAIDSTGCEANLRTIATCGNCTSNCTTLITHASGPSCSASGTCDYGACSGSFSDCDGSRANGCETGWALATCGPSCTNCSTAAANASGQVCTAGGTCDFGACVGRFSTCDGNRANGCEAAWSPMQCGPTCTNCNSTLVNATGRACTAGGTCDYATCSSGFSDCDANRMNGCENPWSAASCGAACTNCSSTILNASGPSCSGTGSCDYGSCASSFADCDGNRANGCEQAWSTTRCGTSCTNCSTAIANATGALCTMGGTCDYGGACTGAFSDCDGNRANGCERSWIATACGPSCTNCSASVLNVTGRVCTAGGTCDYTACSAGFSDCDGNRANGCETAWSAADCGPACTDCSLTLQNASGGFCGGAGGCNYGSCNPGFGDCDGNRSNGCEVSTTLDTRCGACVNDCTDQNVVGGTCSAGVCEIPGCTVGRANCDGLVSNGCEALTAGTAADCCGMVCTSPPMCDPVGMADFQCQ